MGTPVPAAWWVGLDPNQLGHIAREVAINPNLTSQPVFSDGERQTADRIVVDDLRVPSSLRSVLAGKKLARITRDAVLYAFRVWLVANPGDSGEDVVALLDALLDSATSETDRKQARQVLDERFGPFRSELIEVMQQFAEAMNDHHITGEWKGSRPRDPKDSDSERVGGRYVLDHKHAPGTRIERSGRRWHYRTADGYLAHSKRGLLQQLTVAGRGDEDWYIATMRAVRHAQAEETVKLLIDSLPSGRGQGLSRAGRYGLRLDEMVSVCQNLLTEVKAGDFGALVRNELSSWDALSSSQEFADYAEIPAESRERIGQAWLNLTMTEGRLRQFVQERRELDDDADDADDHKAVFHLGRSALEEYLSAMQNVYEAVVACCERFHEWVLRWTRKQLEKGFRTEHPLVWGALRATKLILTATNLAVNITLDVVTAGAWTFLAIPVFMGLQSLVDRIETTVVNHYVDKDMAKLESDGELDKFLGQEYRTARDRALRAVGRKAEFVVKRMEQAQSLNDKRAQAVGAPTAFVDMINHVHEMEGLGGLGGFEEAVLGFEQGLDPLSGALPVAGMWAGHAVAGASFAIELTGTLINVVVPPKLVETLDQAHREALSAALDHAIYALTDEGREELRQRLGEGVHYEVMLSDSGGTLKGAVVDADGTRFKVTLDPDLLRLAWRTRDVAATVITRAAGRHPDIYRGQADDVPVEPGYVYLTHPTATALAVPYDPVADPEVRCLVRFAVDDLLAATPKESEGRFVLKHIDGERLGGDGRVLSTPAQYTVVLTTEAVGHYRNGPWSVPQPSAAKKKAKKKVMSKAKRVLAHSGSSTS